MPEFKYRRFSYALVALLALGGAARAADPEGESQGIAKQEVVAHKYMVVAANPLASKAGADMLAVGGSAADAAIAAQLVLTLVEPQSSGLGGGGFLTFYDHGADKLVVYDGRETAPASADENLFLGPDGQPLPFVNAAIGGKPVGVPGIVRLMEAVHKDYGKLPWAKLFEPAIKLAENGFAVTPRLNWWLTSAKDFLSNSPDLKSHFYKPDGSPLAVGEIYKSPELAKTLHNIADRGAAAFYSGPLAEEIVKTVNQGIGAEGHPNPGGMALDDLKNYQAIKREAVCGPYRRFEICGAGPPSAGAVGVIELLGMLQRFDPMQLTPQVARTYHLFAEASRRAFADRDAYLGDPAVVDVPVKGLIDPTYLAMRSGTIDRVQATPNVTAGDPPGKHAAAGSDGSLENAGTSHMSLVDAAGNGVSFTTTVNGPFGSHLMAGGFVLNNQLTDFSFRPELNGKKVANRVQGGKRPRSSMAPLIIFEGRRHLRLLIGSPGGSKIIDYVALATVAHLDWGLGIQQAVDHGNVVNTGGRTELEQGTPVAQFADALRGMGHQVEVTSETSGLHAIAVMKDGLHGGADGRREGVAIGE
ncbi:MAG: gamma-glutamyltransferase [Rhodospirillales bacterium]|nr:gamma-glutamyltransferase [Rhodospirillales bacterium]